MGNHLRSQPGTGIAQRDQEVVGGDGAYGATEEA